MNTITGKLVVLTLLFVGLLPTYVFAGSWNTNKNDVVLDGFDVVSYRTNDRATKGLSQFMVPYDGVKFHFATQKHMDMFAENPQKFLPKFNGYCAFAVGSNNAKVPANADTFKIYNGELLMFFNDLYKGNKFNTKIPWNSDEKKLFRQAEKNWAKLK